MALQYQQPHLNMFMHTGVRCALNGNNPSISCPVTIFSGTQPSAANIIASWTSYNGSALVHWTDAQWPQPADYNTLGATKATTATLPTAKNAFNSGTATWALIWSGTNIGPTITQANVQSATLPSTYFIVVPVSNGGGNGVVKMTSTTIASGSSYQPIDITLRVGLA